MQNISYLASKTEEQGSGSAKKEEIVDLGVKRLFGMMFAAYGSAWLSKWSTGQSDAQGKDPGVRLAMKTWSSYLSNFDAATIESAFERCLIDHPNFPPGLPQFLAICEARRPRETLKPENIVAAPVAQSNRPEINCNLKGDGLDWARKITAKAAAGYPVSAFARKNAAEVLKGRA